MDQTFAKASHSIFMLCANKTTDFATAVAGLNLDFVIFQSYVLDVILVIEVMHKTVEHQNIILLS